MSYCIGIYVKVEGWQICGNYIPSVLQAHLQFRQIIQGMHELGF